MVHDSRSLLGFQTRTEWWGDVDGKLSSDRTYWPEMKSQQKPLGGSVVCGHSSAVPAAKAAAAAGGAEPVRKPQPLPWMGTNVAKRNTSVEGISGYVVSSNQGQAAGELPRGSSQAVILLAESQTLTKHPTTAPSFISKHHLLPSSFP